MKSSGPRSWNVNIVCYLFSTSSVAFQNCLSILCWNVDRTVESIIQYIFFTYIENIFWTSDHAKYNNRKPFFNFYPKKEMHGET